MSTTVTFSRLLREPTEVLPLLETGDVLVTRREGPDMWLSLHSHHRADSEGVHLIAEVVSASLENVRPQLGDGLRATFPWMTFLPERYQGQFIAEFFEVARACASIGEFRQLALTVEAWRETSAAYAAGISPTLDESQLLDTPEDVPDPRSL